MVLLFEPTHLLVYLFLLFFYLALTDYFAPMFHRALVIDPLLLAYSSAMLFSLLENKGELVFVQYLVMVLFLTGYHQLRGKVVKEFKEKEEVTIHFYVKRLLLPLVYPVAVYFALQFFVQGTLALYFYSMIYFFVIIYFTKYIQTAFYYGYFMLTQLIILAYLFQFIGGITTLEKVLMYAFLLATATGRYLYTRKRGGEKDVSFIQALFRKNLQKSKNRTGLRERH